MVRIVCLGVWRYDALPRRHERRKGLHTMIPGCLGRPTMDGKTARGASSPAKPALHIPEPLSTTRAWGRKED